MSKSAKRSERWQKSDDESQAREIPTHLQAYLYINNQTKRSAICSPDFTQEKDYNSHSDQSTSETSNSLQIEGCSRRSQRSETSKVKVSEGLVVELVVVDADVVGREVGRGFGKSVELLGKVDS